MSNLADELKQMIIDVLALEDISIKTLIQKHLCLVMV
jgi:hypothetical protein